MVTVPYRNFDFYRKALHMIGNIYIYLLKKIVRMLHTRNVELAKFH